MKGIFLVLAVVMLFSCSMAISIIKPINAEIRDNEVYDLGKMGPGQAMSILIERTETTGGIYGKGGYYDFANASMLPEGWKVNPSLKYDNPLQVVLISSENATEGRYTMQINVIDENNGEQLGTRTFAVAIYLNESVLGFDKVSGTNFAGEGQPLRYTMLLQNKGNAGDVFVVEANTFRQNNSREIYLAPGSEVKMPFEFSYLSSGDYNVTFKAYSKLSPNKVKKEIVYPITIRNSLEADLKSLGNGVIIFPLFEHGSYAIAHILSSILG